MCVHKQLRDSLATSAVLCLSRLFVSLQSCVCVFECLILFKRLLVRVMNCSSVWPPWHVPDEAKYPRADVGDGGVSRLGTLTCYRTICSVSSWVPGS